MSTRLLITPLFLCGTAFGQSAPPEKNAADEKVPSKPCCSEPKDGTHPLPIDRKSVLLRNVLEKLTQSAAPFIGQQTLRDLEQRVGARSKNLPPDRRFPLVFALAETYLGVGRIEDAIAQYNECLSIAESSNDARAANRVFKRLGLSWLRVAERRNCVANHNEYSCILPLREQAIHKDRQGSEEAVKFFTKALEVQANDVEAIWMLNIASMTLGEWPASIPAQWRIPPSAFASERDMPRMVDVAPKFGLNVKNHAGGSAMDDFDGDGRLDIVTSGSGISEPMHYFHQNPDGTFRDIAAEVGLDGQICALNFIHFDANNDGRLDLYIPRGAWMHQFGKIPNSLLIQQPDGTFVDRTLEAGIELAAPSQNAAVADIDNDGDLDLFCGFEASGPAEDFPCHLFRNRGDGTFEDITDSAGVANNRYAKGCNFGDYDGDGLPDLYVSNMQGFNRLYHNDGGGRFHDVAASAGVLDPYDSFSCFFFDYNNDGWLDLYVSCYNQGQRMVDVAAYYRNGATGGDTQRLYENDGHGGFRDVTKLRGMNRCCFPMGSNFGDIDNDGWPDLYLATGEPDYSSLWPNILLHNDGGQRFEDVTSATGTGHLQKGHGVSFGDVDGDGDQDLFVELGGALVDDAFHNALFENPGHGNHWLTVRLLGHKTNHFGVGARIRATIQEGSEGGAKRDVYSFVGGNSSFGGNSLQAELGLGRATRLVSLEVKWPASKTVQTFTDVRLDSTIVVEEGENWRVAPKPAARASSDPGSGAKNAAESSNGKAGGSGR